MITYMNYLRMNIADSMLCHFAQIYVKCKIAEVYWIESEIHEHVIAIWLRMFDKQSF